MIVCTGIDYLALRGIGDSDDPPRVQVTETPTGTPIGVFVEEGAKHLGGRKGRGKGERRIFIVKQFLHGKFLKVKEYIDHINGNNVYAVRGIDANE